MHFGFSFCILMLVAISQSYSLDKEVKGIVRRNPALNDLITLMRSPRLARHRFSKGALVRRGCASSKGCRDSSAGGPARQSQQQPQQRRQQQQSQPQPARSRDISPIPSLARSSSSRSAGGEHHLVSAADVNLHALARGSPSWDQRIIRAGSVRPGQMAAGGPSQLGQHNSGQSVGSQEYNSGQTVRSGAVSLPSRPGTP